MIQDWLNSLLPTPTPVPQEVGDPKTARTLIVVYNTMWHGPLQWEEIEIPESCALTTNRSYLEKATAVVFHIPTLGRMPAPKPNQQLWVGWTLECDLNISRQRSESFMEQFDLVISYKLDSDIPALYVPGEPEILEELTAPPAEKSELAAAFISSSINQSGRCQYLRELMKHMPIHSYGKKLNNRKLESDQGWGSKREALKKYRFTVAFENAVAPDYVTEKFFHPLSSGSVPIYLGAPNVEQFAPGDNCYLNVSDFTGPEELARRLLDLAADEEQYNELLAWKKRPLRPGFLEMVERSKENIWLRLIQKIQERR